MLNDDDDDDDYEQLMGRASDYTESSVYGRQKINYTYYSMFYILYIL